MNTKEKERLQAALEFVHKLAQAEDSAKREAMRLDRIAQLQREILRGCTEPWTD